MPTDPPSYSPQGPKRRRPDDATARPVGEQVPPTRKMPGDNPPSYAPAGTSEPAETPPPSYLPGGGPQQIQQPPPSGYPQGPPPEYFDPQIPTAPPEPTEHEPPRSPKRKSRGKKFLVTTSVLLVLLLAWPVGLLIWANGKLNHVDALSTAGNTSGRTYLLAGSDSREDLDESDAAFDKTEGARTDTILLLHVPDDGKSSLISLPRDSYVEIPGQGFSKLNAAYAWGGPELLVETVENLSGFKVDHYVEVGF